MIRFTCPSCGKSLKAPPTAVGQTARCPTCGHVMVIGGSESPPPLTLEPEPAAYPEPPPPVLVPIAAPVAPAPPNYVPAAPLEEVAECPFCAELVKVRAKKCRHCGETLDVALRAAEEAKREARRGRGSTQQQVVIHQRIGGGRREPSFPHALHLVLTIFTLGLWLPVWIIHLIVWELT